MIEQLQNNNNTTITTLLESSAASHCSSIATLHVSYEEKSVAMMDEASSNKRRKTSLTTAVSTGDGSCIVSGTVVTSELKRKTPTKQCIHEITYKSLCCQCGENVKNSPVRQSSSNGGGAEDGSNSRISVSLDWMMCGSAINSGGDASELSGLVVNHMGFLKSIYESDVQSILRCRKLRLVLDLDETLIHSVAIRSTEQEKKFSEYQQQLRSQHVLRGTEPQYYYYTPSNYHNRSSGVSNGNVGGATNTKAYTHQSGGNDEKNSSSCCSASDSQFLNWEHFQQQKKREKLSQIVCVEQLEQDCFTFVLGTRRFVIFVRPYLYQFLAEMSKCYDMYIYTNGTERYASVIHQHLATLFRTNYIQALFTRRSSREREMKRLVKVLCKRSVSVILDDRSDVWIDGDRENIVKIDPYTFEGFLAKEQEADESGVESEADEMDIEHRHQHNSNNHHDVDDAEGDEDDDDNEECLTTVGDEFEDDIIVEDEDEEFLYVTEHLTKVHTQFFDLYDRLQERNVTGTSADVRDVLEELKREH